MKQLILVPPTDPRVNTMLAPQNDLLLKDHGYKNRQELADALFEAMKRYGGIGLSANQCGLPFNVFVLGDHPQLEKGKKMICFNPKITQTSKETILMKEGCLTFPWLFLSIKRPSWVKVKYENDDKESVEEYLHGMSARVFQHEYDHMEGKVFTSLVSKMKLDLAEKKRKKDIKNATRNKSQS